MHSSSNVFDILKQRGFVQQVTHEETLKTLLSKPPITIYIGYDPTADSLHVGNLFTLMAVKHLENAGHRILIVAGGGTARIGDPSGKTELRQMLSTEQIDGNLQHIKAQIGQILDLNSGHTQILNNADWLLNLNYVNFLRDIGKHFSVNRMLSAESYKQRLERGLSFIELNYQILQSYDYVQLAEQYDCKLQLGGDDQWGNILAGVDLCRRVLQKDVFGLTFPLVLTASGQKMGKTASGAVWLDANKVSPFDYYQFWVNTEDKDVAKFLSFYTFLPIDEIEKIKSLEGGPLLNNAKNILAYEATHILHGEQAAKQAHQAAMAAFGDRKIPNDLLPSSQVQREVSGEKAEIPTLEITKEEIGAGLLLVDILTRCGLSDSKKQARRLIEQGGVRIDEAKVTDVQQMLDMKHFVAEELLLRSGKKHVHRIKLV